MLKNQSLRSDVMEKYQIKNIEELNVEVIL